MGFIELIDLELIDFKFIWHFTNHRIHWDIPQEPQTEYNILNSIVTHTDLIKHNILRDYSDNSNFITLNCIVLYCSLLYCIVLYYIVLYCIVLYCVVLYYIE